MADKRNVKKKKKARVLPMRTSSRLAEKKGTSDVLMESEVEGDVEKDKSDDGSHGDNTKEAPSVKAIAVVSHTRRHPNSAKMDAIIAAELQADSDIGDDVQSVRFESPIRDEVWEEMTRPLSVGSGACKLASDSEGSIVIEPKKKSKKTKATAKKGSIIETVKLIVPHGLEKDTYTRISVSITESFEDILEKMHDAIGCQDIQQKPSLKYKFNGVKGAKKMKFQTENDWEGLLEELLIIGKGKKDVTSISVDIDLPTDYSDNLRYTLNKKKGTKVKPGAKTFQKKGSAPCINLNGSDSDEEDSDKEGVDDMSSKEKQAVTTLKNYLHGCETSSCNNNRCKIDKNGQHCEITWGKLRIWAQALAAGKYGVTYKNPPKTDLFSNFHTQSQKEVVKNTVPAAEEKGGLGPNQYILGVPGSYPMWPPPVPYPSAPYLPGPHPVGTSGPEWSLKRNGSPEMGQHPTSDDSDMVILHPFQTIDELLTALARHPDAEGRNLDEFKATFKKNGVLRVHELEKITQEKLGSQFALNWGDARFLHHHINKSARDTRALRDGERAAKRQRVK